ncbi:MAG TPA: CPBP family intramembrane glutamic endopeptidase [Verrucomicrobiae bacterium]
MPLCPLKIAIVSPPRLRYAKAVLWRIPWKPEIVLLLVGGGLTGWFGCTLLGELLRLGKVSGFASAYEPGSLLVATLSLHGTTVIAAAFFLHFHQLTWRDLTGRADWRWWRQAGLVLGMLVVVLPLMGLLKTGAEAVMQYFGLPVEDQAAVDILLKTGSPAARLYLAVFTVTLAPLAEEILFRGLIYSGLKKAGWPRAAWLINSGAFAAIHFNLPILLPLFLFALVQTWLYEKTEGLLAPVLAHSLFNAINLVTLYILFKIGQLPT